MLALLLSLIICCPNREIEPEIYSVTAVVIDIDAEDDYVRLADIEGNGWNIPYYDEYEPELEDVYTLTVYNNNTSEIHDDYVICYEWAGSIELFKDMID